jgi:DNA-binding HxlR family transcriptional regulator
MKISNKQISALSIFGELFTHQREAEKNCGKATLRALVHKGLVMDATMGPNFGYRLTAKGRDLQETDRALRQLADPALSTMCR